MKSISEEKMHFHAWLHRCDRIMRTAVIMANVIGGLFVLVAEFLMVQIETVFLAIALLCACGLPMLYYNIVVTIAEHRFLRQLRDDQGDDREK